MLPANRCSVTFSRQIVTPLSMANAKSTDDSAKAILFAADPARLRKAPRRGNAASPPINI
jgi:hypothetical protein